VCTYTNQGRKGKYSVKHVYVIAHKRKQKVCNYSHKVSILNNIIYSKNKMFSIRTNKKEGQCAVRDKTGAGLVTSEYE